MLVAPEPKFRTTVYLSRDAYFWSKGNLRNLSVFLEHAIKSEMKFKELEITTITCDKCGASGLSPATLAKYGGKCPECKTQLRRVI